MTERIDCAVIGAGVVGLAVARRLALAGRSVVVLEKADAIGTETSSRNSEVIHAGIYYATGWLKAKLCVAGNRALYSYCAEHGVAHKRIGKIIVACSDSEVAALDKYLHQAQANGVSDLTWLSAAQVREMEPAVQCVAALNSPSTGLVDSHALMLAYQGDAEQAGAAVVFQSPVESAEVTGDGILLDVGGKDPTTISCNAVINCAGLYAQSVARSIRGLSDTTIPPIHYAIGHYYTMSGKPAFARLVYPVAVPGSLGIHVALDLAGQVRFGPDIHWIDAIDYRFNESSAQGFYASIRRYFPALADGALQPGYTGIRPKVSGPGEPVKDFVIQGASEHGIPGLVNLYGIESPGLTSSLSIADHVYEMLVQQSAAP
jgi:L-2-hydroxyglutarate oxidase LhgO